MKTKNLSINLERLKKDVLDLAEIGRNEDDRGIYRMAFTEADMKARRWLTDRMESCGLETRRDGAANLFGKLSPQSESGKKLPSALIGSHIDTVPCAGMLDGALGVLTGLECLRSLNESGRQLKRPLEMIAFSDEEGRFGGMFGSQAFCGQITPEKLHSKDLDGIVLGDEMRRRGMDPLEALDARRDPKTVHSYLELHIEQGPVLDKSNCQVGIVDAITGLFSWGIRFNGESNHAGTTPMDQRKDAFMGLAEFAAEIPRILEENGSELSRATVGKAQILPGAVNTVPGIVEFSLDVRDTDTEVLEQLRAAMRRALSAIARRRGLMLDLQFHGNITPVACNADMVDTVERAAKRRGIPSIRMPSGAAHDAQIVSTIAPVAMIFVPSRGGVSHSPHEWTAWDDIEAGANVALDVLTDLASA